MNEYSLLSIACHKLTSNELDYYLREFLDSSSHCAVKIIIFTAVAICGNAHKYQNLSLPDPLGDWTILLHLLGKFPFYAESFQSGHFYNVLSI